MKKIGAVIALAFSCLLAACGAQKDSGESTWRGIQVGMEDLTAITGRMEYYDITAIQEPVFQWEKGEEASLLADKANKLVGMQFYQEEPVQLWSVRVIRGEAIVWELYLYRQDGSRELLLPEMGMFASAHAYLDSTGNLYLWRVSGKAINSGGEAVPTTDPILKKYDSLMELLYEKELDYGYDIQEIRQTADGKVYLFISDKGAEGEGARKLAKLEPATGDITELGTVSISQEVVKPHFGIWGEKLVTFKFHSGLGNEIVAVNTDDGTEDRLLSFKGTSYTTPGLGLQDFRVLEDESVELLWASDDGSYGLMERLRMEKVEKTPIVLRGQNTEGWLARQINSFNRQSESYHIIIEDCGQGNDVEDFARLTSVQIAAGKGPDILYGSLMRDYISGLIEKGALEDLRPYMDRSGIREEDYFPFVFDMWKNGDGIYGVSPILSGLDGYTLDSSVLGGTQEPDINMLVDALLAMPGRKDGQGDTVFIKGCDSQKLLNILLRGTDTLWGMVDWERKSCDFSGGLFAKILETAKRYGDGTEKGEVSSIVQSRNFMQVYLFDDRAEREKEGKVICGMLFDDGCHAAAVSNSALAVNANSPVKEGVWEFIHFLLGDEPQASSGGTPASRKAYGEWVEKQKKQLSDGKEIHMAYSYKLPDGSLRDMGAATYTETDITDEIIEEYTKTLEDARPYPLRTAPILDIISEEAEDYFNGSKSAEEVAGLVTNRVQTYLDEGR